MVTGSMSKVLQQGSPSHVHESIKGRPLLAGHADTLVHLPLELLVLFVPKNFREIEDPLHVCAGRKRVPGWLMLHFCVLPALLCLLLHRIVCLCLQTMYGDEGAHTCWCSYGAQTAEMGRPMHNSQWNVALQGAYDIGAIPSDTGCLAEQS